ncbi:MAG: hypothetical protein NT105_24155 [Verrucomicrobia bacterium]|nr:hypothetical protein [Verrucomicrobiota bacterium]
MEKAGNRGVLAGEMLVFGLKRRKYFPSRMLEVPIPEVSGLFRLPGGAIDEVSRLFLLSDMPIHEVGGLFL